MSDFNDDFANALGAFKMQLDARDLLAARTTRRPDGMIVRESRFEAQLPIVPAPKQPQPVPPSRGYTLVIAGSTLSTGSLSPANGTFTLSFAGLRPGDGPPVLVWSYGPDGTGPSGPNDTVAQYVWAISYTASNPPASQWDISVTVNPPGGAEFEAQASAPSLSTPYPNIIPNGTGTATFY